MSSETLSDRLLFLAVYVYCICTLRCSWKLYQTVSLCSRTSAASELLR